MVEGTFRDKPSLARILERKNHMFSISVSVHNMRKINAPTFTQVPPSFPSCSIKATFLPYDAARRYVPANEAVILLQRLPPKSISKHTYRSSRTATPATNENDVVFLARGWFLNGCHIYGRRGECSRDLYRTEESRTRVRTAGNGSTRIRNRNAEHTCASLLTAGVLDSLAV